MNTIPNYQSEPYSVDERLLYHAKRAICWLELAAKGKLVTESEPFELPEFSMSNILEMQFAFSEDVVTFMQWESVECRYGIAELDVYKSKPFVYYVSHYYSSLLGNIYCRSDLVKISKFQFVESRKSVFKEVLYEENRMYNAMYYAFICFECLWWRCQ